MKPQTALDQMEGALRYAVTLHVPIKDATQQHFNTWGNALRNAPGRRRRGHPTFMSPKHHQDLQEQAHYWVSTSLGAAHAMNAARIDPMDFEGVDITTRILTPNQIHVIQVRLEGEDLFLIVVLTATGIMVREVRNLLVGTAVDVDGICFLMLPPTASHPEGRAVPLHHDDGVVFTRQDMLRRDHPKQKHFCRANGDEETAIEAKRLQNKVHEWGTWVGRDDLTAFDLRLSYIAFLLAQPKVNVFFVAHVAGTTTSVVRVWRRQVLAAMKRGVDFGQPIKGTAAPIGYNPCPKCGKKDNPVGPTFKHCGNCKNLLPEQPTRVSSVLADLQSALQRLKAITGETMDDRARDALGHLGSTEADDSGDSEDA